MHRNSLVSFRYREKWYFCVLSTVLPTPITILRDMNPLCMITLDININSILCLFLSFVADRNMLDNQQKILIQIATALYYCASIFDIILQHLVCYNKEIFLFKMIDFLCFLINSFLILKTLQI